MPNGFHGSRDQWERFNSALAGIDSLLRDYATSHGVSLHSNEKAWPSRALKWTDDLCRCIQIYLESEDLIKFTVGVHAFKDESGRRLWRSTTLADDLGISELAAILGTLLDEARDIVQSWTIEDLEATE